MTTTAPVPAISGTDVAEAGLDVRPLSGHIGAEIFGVDLAGDLDPSVVAAIRTTLLRWKVVFFRDQHLSPAQHIAFGGLFGKVTPAHPTLPPTLPDHPEILVLDSLAYAKMDGASVESRWHTDVTFVPNPPMGSILRGVVVPPYGGDTQFANLVVACERLSEPLRQMLRGLHAVHQNVLPLARGELSSETQQLFQAKDLRAVHPVIRVHPETGEEALFVNPNFTSHIVELSRQEGRHLLAMLYEHMFNAAYTARFRWRTDSIAFWDNRATAHLVPTDVPAGMHRSMQRITLAGDIPEGADGSVSYSLSGGEFN
jgi:alpha-ketoglutarate-dependent sulfate ester dioxygenase